MGRLVELDRPGMGGYVEMARLVLTRYGLSKWSGQKWCGKSNRNGLKRVGTAGHGMSRGSEMTGR